MKDEMVYVKIDGEMKTNIENYRKQFDPIPTRSEAIRQLIKKGLAAP